MNTLKRGSFSQLGHTASLNQGFSLIELMIVVVIIGILAAIVIPSYQGQVAQTRRSEAQRTLMTAAQQLEACFSNSNPPAYNSATCTTLTANADFTGMADGYVIAVNPQNATSYTMTATPVAGSSQANYTTCHSFAIDHTGNRTAKDKNGNANTTCWTM